jgi:5'-3' exonuclease
MVPGWHYSWPVGDRVGEREPYFVPTLGQLQPKYHADKFMKNGDPKLKKLEGTGLTWFYCQLITGDSTDNIPGCPGAGPAKALAALKDCETEVEMYDSVLGLYADKYLDEAIEEFGVYAAEHSIDRDHTDYEYEAAREDFELAYIEKELLEQAYLLWMVQELDAEGKPVMWKPPLSESKSGGGNE